jgi:PAS domain S-box-containing protein
VVHELLRAPPPPGPQSPSGPAQRRAPILGSYLGCYEEGIAVVAPDGRVRLFTAGLERITGYSAAEVPTIGEAVPLLAPDEATEHDFREFFEQGLGARESGERLVRIRARDRRLRWLRVSVHRVNEDILLHVLDITSIHRVQPPEPTDRAPWCNLLEELELGVWTTEDTATWRLTWANAATRTILGIGPRWDGAAPGPLLAFADPTDRVRLQHALLADRFTQARTVRMGARLARPGDRAPVNAELTVTASYDAHGHPIRVVGTLRDLDAERSAKARRAREHLLQRALFERVSVGVVVGTLDGVFLAANSAFCELLGYHEADLLGRHVEELVHPDDQLTFSRAREAPAAGGRQYIRYPRRYLHREGHVVPCEVTLVAVSGDEGAPACGIALVLPTGTA